MKIAKATRKNIDEIVNVEMNSGYHDRPVESDIRKLFIDFFNLKNIYIYILKDGKNVIGYFAFRVVRNNCELDYIAIINKYQGKGLGKLLLNKVILLCKVLKLSKIELPVRHSNDVAINLYKKYGFEITEKSKTKLFMSKELK